MTTTTDQRPLPRAAWTELSNSLANLVRQKTLNVSGPLFIEAVARKYNPNATGMTLDVLVGRAQDVIDALTKGTLTEADLLSGYPRLWFPAIEAALDLPTGYCNGILDAATAAIAQPPTVWDGMVEPPAEEDSEPEPETSVFETLDDKNHNPGVTLATADLAALTAPVLPTDTTFYGQAISGQGIALPPVAAPEEPTVIELTEREELAFRVAQISGSYVDALMALEHLRVDGIRPGALAAAKNTTTNAFAEALKAIAGIEDHK